MAEMVPAPTFDVYARWPLLEITSMCDSGASVGIESITFRAIGSMTLIERVSSAVTYNLLSVGLNTAPCGLLGAPRSMLAATARDFKSIIVTVLPSVPGRPTPEFPYIGTHALWPSEDAATSSPV